MKKSKNIPAIVTLLGCAVAVIVSYINKYELEKTLKVLLIVLFIFLFMGLFIKYLFDKYIPYIEEEPPVEEDEGSVIEKSSEDGMIATEEDGSVLTPNPEESDNV